MESVLSTHVEVVRGFELRIMGSPCALHARGGGPNLLMQLGGILACSPRTWRWSDRGAQRRGHLDVLSTHVEVVRHRMPLGGI